MDEGIAAAARALALGDALAALNQVALRDDAPALALRGIALAQLGDFDRARALVRRAARAFGPGNAVARARCALAEGEIALAARDLAWPGAALRTAQRTLAAHGDWRNAAYAQYLEVRRLLLVGELERAAEWLERLDRPFLPHDLRAIHDLLAAGLAMRQLRAGAARAALAAEVARAASLLDAPVAQVRSRGGERPARLDEVEALLAGPVLVVDACRYVVCAGAARAVLARRPVLFALARALAEAWPGEVAREALIGQVFRTRVPDESHRARLRVEIGRLRAALRGMAAPRATGRGYVLAPDGARQVAVLAQPVQTPHAAVLALLADGQAWSSSALALALDASQRSVQRALQALAAAGRAQALGRGRTRRWVAAPAAAFATNLLLCTALPAF
ncbi:hypothetical protein [Bordetella bronchiseptica]|uniref:hypothetical protein n=1 Tax=Bordetella bronchiseptica TaxID=518 RepID=UPI00053A3A60|nr:hypothetical protein [Bordetella bronchiseptica]